MCFVFILLLLYKLLLFWLIVQDYINGSTVPRGALIGSNYTLLLVSSVFKVFSGNFSLGGSRYVTSATTLDLCRSCSSGVPDIVFWPPFNLGHSGYSHESFYLRSILSDAGLNIHFFAIFRGVCPMICVRWCGSAPIWNVFPMIYVWGCWSASI